MEDQIQALKLELEFKDEKVSALNKELDAIHSSLGNGQEISSLKRQKIDMERRLRDQEDELDDLSNQIHVLEQAKLKSDMTLGTLKKDHKRELSLKEEELEEAKSSANKKLKVLEQQLEQEHEDRLRWGKYSIWDSFCTTKNLCRLVRKP